MKQFEVAIFQDSVSLSKQIQKVEEGLGYISIISGQQVIPVEYGELRCGCDKRRELRLDDVNFECLPNFKYVAHAEITAGLQTRAYGDERFARHSRGAR